VGRRAPRPATRPRPGGHADAPRAPGRPPGATGDRTRERIVSAALETFAEHGFAGCSMRDVARKARIRVSSLYHYFPSKEELFQDILDNWSEEMRALVLSAMGKGLELPDLAREATGKIFDFFVANPAYVRLGLHNRANGGVPFDRRVIDRWLGMMDGVMKPAEMRGAIKAVDPLCLIVTVEGLVHWHLANDGFYRAILGRGLDDPEVLRRTREHVVQVVLRTAGLE
jgi:AcrR family transcriptional regulator